MTIRTTILPLLLSFTAWGQTYLIYTMAGNGTQGYIGDGGAATSAELALPGSIAFDSSGNAYTLRMGQNNVVHQELPPAEG